MGSYGRRAGHPKGEAAPPASGDAPTGLPAAPGGPDPAAAATLGSPAMAMAGGGGGRQLSTDAAAASAARCRRWVARHAQAHGAAHGRPRRAGPQDDQGPHLPPRAAARPRDDALDREGRAGDASPSGVPQQRHLGHLLPLRAHEQQQGPLPGQPRLLDARVAPAARLDGQRHVHALVRPELQLRDHAASARGRHPHLRLEPQRRVDDLRRQRGPGRWRAALSAGAGGGGDPCSALADARAELAWIAERSAPTLPSVAADASLAASSGSCAPRTHGGTHSFVTLTRITTNGSRH